MGDLSSVHNEWMLIPILVWVMLVVLGAWTVGEDVPAGHLP